MKMLWEVLNRLGFPCCGLAKKERSQASPAPESLVSESFALLKPTAKMHHAQLALQDFYINHLLAGTPS